MSALALVEPPAERVEHSHAPIQNVSGRLGMWAP